MDWSRYYTCAFPPSILGYIKDYQVYDPHRVGRITVELQGRVKDCKALTYRQDIKARDIENYRLRMLPTHQVCHILMFNILSWMLVFPFYTGKGLGFRMGSVFVLLKSHLFMKEWNSSSYDLSYYLSFPLSVQWGYVVITTPDGVLDHEEAIKKNVGGQVLGYFL